MKCRQASSGYTILEVLIYLTVSSALLISAMLLINGKAEKTRFIQGVGTMELKIKDIMNDTSTGYYPSQENIRCTLDSTTGAPNISIPPTSPPPKGTNQDCVFVGKAIQYNLNSAQYTAYTMVGSGAKTVTGLSNANIRLLGHSGVPGISEPFTNEADLQVVRIVSRTDSARSVNGIALVSDFAQTTGVGNGFSGNATKVTLYELTNNYFTDLNASNIVAAPNGVILCLQQPGGKRASLIIGTDGQLSTEIIVDGWASGC